MGNWEMWLFIEPLAMLKRIWPPPAPGSFLARFLGDTQEMTPAQRGTYLEHPPEGAPSIDAAHEASAGRRHGTARRAAAAAPLPSLLSPAPSPVPPQAAAQQGATAAPDADADVDLHFAALVCKAGRLYELDGRKAAPVDHGPTSPDTLLEDAGGWVGG